MVTHQHSRLKDMIIRGGENVYCQEVEAALYEHPCVMDACVVGLPDVRLGEEVIAAVQIKDNTSSSSVTSESLRAFLKSRLASFKIPVWIDVGKDQFTRNAAGKILKKDLKVSNSLFEDAPTQRLFFR